MNDVVIGIDASTTAVKAIAFTRDGNELFQARQAYPSHKPQPGHFEQDPEDWWTALLAALTQVAERRRRLADSGAVPSPISARPSR